MNFYIDIIAKRTPGTPTSVYLGLTLFSVHAYLAKGNKIYVDFPETKETDEKIVLGNKMRLFSEEKNQLEIFLDILKKNERLKDVIDISRIKWVPDDVEKYQKIYRVRLPSRYKCKRETYSGEKENEFKKRLKILNHIQRLPYVPMRSISTKQVYSIYFEKIIKNKDEITNFEQGELDGYGFSHKTHPIWIPVF